MSKSKKYYTVPEFAEEAGVSTQTIYQQLKRGRLKNYGHKHNGVQKIDGEALSFYRPEPDPGPEEQEQTQSEGSPEAVTLLREQIRILSETLEHERQTLEHEREMHRQTQEALRQTQELMKAQMVQFALTTKQKPEEADPAGDPVPDGADRADQEAQTVTDPEQAQDQKDQTQPQPDPENQRDRSGDREPEEREPKRRGFFSRLFGL